MIFRDSRGHTELFFATTGKAGVVVFCFIFITSNMEEIKKLRIDANHKQGADADALFSQAYEKLGSLASSAKGEELGDVLSEWADTLAVEFEQYGKHPLCYLLLTTE